MGGVDKLDWNVQKYRIKIRGKKWYFPIFTNAVDVALVNAHTIYCIANGKMPLLNFRREVARFYLNLHSVSDPKNCGRPSYSVSSQKRAPEDVRKNPQGHYLERTLDGKQRKCAVCKKNVRKQCVKCDVGLHVECVIPWHS
ncbi:chimeric ERCC6-PGBD3 protein [Trichonephila clavata]|uniref:Chimeric ERCC6-PGBD3 protein n=1 Tax=Trichonephila clavata TaxID=2740835 RepID=A0A8X6GL98_TRICU|nr:chimeric ERCC6-PGBD3 protein [Trichonephila clavata]